MNTIKDRIKATKAQLRIAVKQANQADRLVNRLVTQLDKLGQRQGKLNAKPIARKKAV